MKPLGFFCFCLMVLASFARHSCAQSAGVIPTKGTDFWLGFMKNADEQPQQAKDLRLFITGTKNTTGTVEIGGQPHTNFSVSANETTTLILPYEQLEHRQSGIVQEKSVHVTTQDTVSVFGINFRQFTADGTKILPIQSLGTSYRPISYSGDSFGQDFVSTILLVATADNTEVEITPSAPTFSGQQAGQTFTVQLDAGQTYQLEAELDGDLSGSTVVGTDSSGACRPFAVFSGATAFVPTDCNFGDLLFEQNFPTNTWGQEFFSVPYAFADQYTLRVMAHQDSTLFNFDQEPLSSGFRLDAGEVREFNNLDQGRRIHANKGIVVAQYMEGEQCSDNDTTPPIDPEGVPGTGDPAMLILNSQEQRLNDITFSTVESDTIEGHSVNIIVESSAIGTVTLDGQIIAPNLFQPFPGGTSHSFAQLDGISEGSHRLQSSEGFTAYVYGLGRAESYSYAVGSFDRSERRTPQGQVCGFDSVTLSPEEPLNNPWWSTEKAPNDTLATGPSLTVKPGAPLTYFANGESDASGCLAQVSFTVENPDSIPALQVSQSTDTLCQFQVARLEARAQPANELMEFRWAPSTGLSDPNSPTTEATPATPTWYKVFMQSANGCGPARVDSVFVDVQPAAISRLQARSDRARYCQGDSIQLGVDLESIAFQDDFDSTAADPALWDIVINGSPASSCGSLSGNALYFDGTGQRFAETRALDLREGGTLRFFIKFGTGAPPCQDADFGEDVVLEYSTDGGATWSTLRTYFEFLYPDFSQIAVAIPAAAQTAGTRLRWRQVSNSGAGQDHWALENVAIGIRNTGNFSYLWSPASAFPDPTLERPRIPADSSQTYSVTVLDANQSCSFTDSINVPVGKPFSLNTTPDTLVCDFGGIQLQATPSVPGNYTYQWEPAASLDAPFLAQPTATPDSTTTYRVTVLGEDGCRATDSITLTVAPPIDATISSPDTLLCQGERTTLRARPEVVLFNEPFNNGIDSSGWANLSNAEASTNCSMLEGQGLYFNGNGPRRAITRDFDLSNGGTVAFAIQYAEVDAAGFCDIPEPGDFAQLHYSTDGGTTWNVLRAAFAVNQHLDWVSYAIDLPAGAFSSNTRFRWRQTNHEGQDRDIWMLDNVRINGTPALSRFTLSWFGENNNLLGNDTSISVSPTSSTDYRLEVVDNQSGCRLSETLPVSVGDSFTASIQGPSQICQPNGIVLSANTSISQPATYQWQPAALFEDPDGAQSRFFAGQDTTVFLTVTSSQGCSQTDSLAITFGHALDFGISAQRTGFCDSGQTRLNIALEDTLLEENFDPLKASNWAVTGGGEVSGDCGSGGGDALLFESGTRRLQTRPLELGGAITIRFTLQYGSGNGFFCPAPEPGEEVVLEYSRNGNDWVTFAGPYNIPTFQTARTVTENLPPAAMGPNTQIRWRQRDASFGDSWWIDNIIIVRNADSADFSVAWSPSPGLSDPSSLSPLATVAAEQSYTATLTHLPSGCQRSKSITVRATDNFTLSLEDSATQCGERGVALTPGVSGIPPAATAYQWQPTKGLSDPSAESPIANPDSSRWYFLEVTHDGGCLKQDSVWVEVEEVGQLLTPDSTISICRGEGLQLEPQLRQLLLVEKFEDSTLDSSKWATFSGGSLGSGCGTFQGQNAQMGESGTRTLATTPLNTTGGGTIAFYFRYGTGFFGGCDPPESNEPAVLQYSTDGLTWQNLRQFPTDAFDSFTLITEDIPPAAQGNNVRFRWTQPTQGGFFGQDIWMVDNVEIRSAGDFSDFNLSWSPTAGLSDPTDPMPFASPDSSTTYTLTLTHKTLGCSLQGRFDVQVGAPFTATTTDDTVVCTGDGVLIGVEHTPGIEASYQWRPSDGLDDPTIQFPTANPSTTTTYTVTVTSAQGCTRTDSLTVAAGNPFNLSLDRGDTSFCQGESLVVSGSADRPGNFSYSWSPTTGVSNPGQATTTLTPNQTTLYTLTATETNGCSDQATLLIRTSTDFQAEIAGPAAQCGQDSVTVSAIVLAGNPNAVYSYQWEPAAAFGQPQSASTTVRFASTDTLRLRMTSNGGCTRSFKRALEVVDQPADLLLQANNNPVCLGQETSVSLSTPSGNFGSWEAQWEPAAAFEQPNQRSTALQSDSSLWVRASLSDPASGCSISDSLFVEVDSVSLDLGPDQNACNGSTVTLSADSGFNSYQWNTGAATRQIQVGSSGNYSVAATADCGTLRDTVEVSFLTDFAPDLGSDTTLCAGDSLSLDAGFANARYTWSTGATSRTVQVAAPDTVWVLVEDSSGLCSGRDTIALTEVPLPTFNLGADTSICAGKSLTLQGPQGPGLSYQWQSLPAQPPIGIADSLLVDTAGTFALTVTNSQGCTFRDTLEVGLDTLPTAPGLPRDTTLCQGDSLTLDATNSGSSYLWSTGATAQSIAVSQADTFWVRITTAAGCTRRDTARVATEAFPSVDLGPDTLLCPQALSIGVPAVPGHSYQWNTGQTTAQISASDSGTYWLEATSPAGCSTRDTLQIRYFNTLTSDLPDSAQACQGDSVLLTGPAGAASYTWSNGQTTREATFSNSQTAVLTYTGPNGCGPFQDSTEVNIHPRPVFALSADTLLCPGDTLSIAHPDLGPAVSWTWSNGSQGTPISVTQAGSLWLEAENAQGCSFRDSLEIVEGEPVAYQLPQEEAFICPGDSFRIGDTAAPGVALSWSTGDSSDFVTLRQAGTYTVSARQAGRCPISDTFRLRVDTIGSLQVPPFLCAGDSATLTAPPAASYQWSTGDTARQITVDTGGFYQVTMTSERGCTFVQETRLPFIEAHQVDLGPDRFLCPEELAELDADIGEAFNYRWSTGDTTRQITVGNAGTYWVGVSNACFSVRDTVRVNKPAPAFAQVSILNRAVENQANAALEIVADTGGYPPLQFSLDSSGGFGQQTRYDNLRGGDTTLYIRDSLGCRYQQLISIPRDLELVIPNTFTPNQDGINDSWEIKNLRFLFPENQVRIYNRWGQLVAEFDGYRDQWQGRHMRNNEPLPDGTYFYVIELGPLNSAFGGSQIEASESGLQKGTVTIMR